VSEGGDNSVEPGDRLPLVPAHTVAFGASRRFDWVEIGVESRFTGQRWLRGDEANVTEPLPGYWTTQLRLRQERGQWNVELVARNLFDSDHATFGTFNVNQGAGGRLERFLTPAEPRTIRVALRRHFGTAR
jgi:outer membrane receptor protein involved in Fe transport